MLLCSFMLYLDGQEEVLTGPKLERWPGFLYQESTRDTEPN